jgi:hypothetical protein
MLQIISMITISAIAASSINYVILFCSSSSLGQIFFCNNILLHNSRFSSSPEGNYLSVLTKYVRKVKNNSSGLNQRNVEKCRKHDFWLSLRSRWLVLTKFAPQKLLWYLSYIFSFFHASCKILIDDYRFL